MRKVRFRLENKNYVGKLKEDEIIVDGKSFKTENIDILPPCSPSKIIGIARNYADHADELNNEVPDFPFMFFKPSNTVIGHRDRIIIPKNSEEIHYEGEVGIVIGKKAKMIDEKNVNQYIDGYTCVNDVTARKWQREESQWARAKGSDTFCPIGPYIQTNIKKITNGIDIETKLNGEKRQSSNTSNMVFSVPELISSISEFITLNKGDIVSTGTPEGVGEIKSGDNVKIEVENVGTLSNKVA